MNCCHTNKPKEFGVAQPGRAEKPEEVSESNRLTNFNHRYVFAMDGRDLVFWKKTAFKSIC